jgi:hypothetical protein
MAVPRLTGLGLQAGSVGGSLQWEYVESNKDVVHRVLTHLEDKRVLWDHLGREDPVLCMKSAQKIRGLVTLEIPNVKQRGPVDKSLTRIRQAARNFVEFGGPDARDYISDLTFFNECVVAMRTTIGEEVVWLASEFNIDLEDDFVASLPGQDLSFIPGFNSSSP